MANRALLQDRLDHALATRTERPLAVLLVDLDNFKQVNDHLGHEAGDELLIEVARRLRESTRVYDTVARLGGDEFAILLEDSDDRSGRRSDRCRAGQPCVIAGRELVTGASVGIATHDGRSSGKELVRRADVAMYEAKRAGKGRFTRLKPRIGWGKVGRGPAPVAA